MASGLSYADAVKLLGGADSRVIATLNRLTGGLLLATSGGGVELALNLFDAKGELARLSGELVTGLGDRMRGLSRFDRTERLTAACRVIAVTAFFEAVRDAQPFGQKGLRLDRSSQVGLATGQNPESPRLHVLASLLNESSVPATALPGPETSSLAQFYVALGADLISFVEHLPLWQRLAEEKRADVIETLRERVPSVALARFEQMFRRLAAEFPEVEIWANQAEHQATRNEIHNIKESLDRFLEGLPSATDLDEQQQRLAQLYLRQLDKPIVETGQAPDWLAIPRLSSAYINPDFKWAHAVHADRLDQERWWWGRDIRHNLQEFLIGHLTSIAATTRPLIVLGQPGSGKSVLTKVLAAQLPPSDFLVVRVALRETPADADLQSQIEYAIRDLIGERVSWPELVRNARKALPVVILDGFDELLQATGVGETDYLRQVAHFQEREADLGRPVAVIVTSRTAVADRARIPASGAVAIKLEPFSQAQVGKWLDVWAEVNHRPLARHELLPLPADKAMAHPELATQPLLLLMLALYDANANELQNSDGVLDKTNLYDRILVSFAEREVRKSQPELREEQIGVAVEAELLRLSVAAFAMFNRGRQWATEAELNADLTALLGGGLPSTVKGFKQPLTPAQITAGRFFFIHEARAVRDDTGMAIEFLHSTFGEFLVARLVSRELADMAAVAEASTVRGRQSPDDAFLRALISFTPLTMRGPVIEFLTVLAHGQGQGRRTLLRRLLLEAFSNSLALPTDTSHSEYAPTPLLVPARLATYSANLLLLITVVGGAVHGSDLFPDAPFPAAEWRRYALLWRSQFTAEGWLTFAAALKLERIWRNGDRDVSIELGPWDPPPLDVFWIFKQPEGGPLRTYKGWRFPAAADLRRESYFTCDLAEDIAWHGLEPFTYAARIDDQHRDEATTGFGILSQAVAISASHALIKVWVVSSNGDDDELAAAYRDCLRVIVGSRGPDETANLKTFLALLLRQLAADVDRLPKSFLDEAFAIYRDVLFGKRAYDADLGFPRWARQAFGDRLN